MKQEQLHLKLNTETYNKIAEKHDKFCKEHKMDISLNVFVISLIVQALEKK